MNNQNNKDSVSDIETIYRHVFAYILDIVEYTDLLRKHNKTTIANNLLELTTIWGESINETRSLNSLGFTLEKLAKSEIETNKIKYWLNLCKYSNDYPNPGNLLKDIDELSVIITELKNRN